MQVSNEMYQLITRVRAELVDNQSTHHQSESLYGFGWKTNSDHLDVFIQQ